MIEILRMQSVVTMGAVACCGSLHFKPAMVVLMLVKTDTTLEVWAWHAIDSTCRNGVDR